MTGARTGSRVRLGRSFQLLYSASIVSAVGDGMGLVALPLLAAHLSANPLAVSSVSFAARLPWLLLGLFAGVMVDRYDRRRLMYGTDFVRALFFAGLALAVVTGAAEIWMLVVFAFVLGTAGTVFDSAAQALIPAVVPDGDEPLQRANGRLYGAQLVGDQLTGRAAGGVLFALAPAVPFALDALSFAGSAALLAGIRGRFRAAWDSDAPKAKPSLWREVGEGVRWLANHHLLRGLALIVASVNAAWMAGQAVLVLLVTGPLHGTSAVYGVMMSGAALGGVAATFAGPRMAARLGLPGTIRFGILLMAAGTAAVGLAPDVYVCGVAFAAIAFAAIVLSVATAPLRQTLAPDALRGRVISAFRVLGLGAMALGAILGGLIAQLLGLRAPFLLGAALIAGCALVAWQTITNGAIEDARSAVAPKA